MSTPYLNTRHKSKDRTVTGDILAMAYTADRRATVTVLMLAALNSLAVAASGLSVREVANFAGSAPGAMLAAATLGAVAYALIATVQRVQHNIQVDLSERVELVLSRRLFHITAKTPTLEHLERAELQDRLSQIRRGTETLAGACWGAIAVISSLISLGLSVWLLAGVHPALAGLVLLAVPPLLFARRASTLLGAARNRTADADRREAHLHRLGTESGAAKELRISGSHREVSVRAARYWDEVTSGLVHAQSRAALWQAAGWACFALGYLGALAFIAHLVAEGQGTPGDLLMVASLSSYLRVQLQATVTGATQVAEGRHTMRHLLWLENHARRQAHSGTVVPPARLARGISLRNVSFTYPGTTTVVMREVNLDLSAGATVAIVGVNGAGKSTMVKLLTGMYEPGTGEITVDGVPLRELDVELWRRQVTAAFQDFCKFEVTAQHAVGVGDLPRADDVDAVRAAVRAADAQAVIDPLPKGLGTQLGRVFDGRELSHGQWQKLALSRALMRRAPLLSILDEPTAALDPQTEHDLYERFMAEHGPGGGITLLVSHRFSTVRMADHIVVLSHGRVAEEGTHDELMDHGGQYAELYHAQSGAYTGRKVPLRETPSSASRVGR